MRRGLTACLCAVVLLTGCGKSYWTESCGDCEVTLRDSGNTEKAVEIVVTVDGEETILKTMAVPAERISAEAFTDILGYSGFRLTERQGLAVQDPAQDWSLRTYYAVEDGSVLQIAESFGWGPPQDYSVDLDEDGGRELVNNVTYGGDGHQDVHIFQRRPDGIWMGRLSTKNLPNHDDRGVTSTAVVYNAERNVFEIRYLMKNSQEPGVVESQGLERVEFTPYGVQEK